jgi:hypothetical protein
VRHSFLHEQSAGDTGALMFKTTLFNTAHGFSIPANASTVLAVRQSANDFPLPEWWSAMAQQVLGAINLVSHQNILVAVRP